MLPMLKTVFNAYTASSLLGTTLVIGGIYCYGKTWRRLVPKPKMVADGAKLPMLGLTRNEECAVVRMADRSLVPCHGLPQCLVTREAIKQYYVEQIKKAACLLKRGDMQKCFLHFKKATMVGGQTQTLHLIKAVLPQNLFVHFVTEYRSMSNQSKATKRDKPKSQRRFFLETIAEVDE